MFSYPYLLLDEPLLELLVDPGAIPELPPPVESPILELETP